MGRPLSYRQPERTRPSRRAIIAAVIALTVIAGLAVLGTSLYRRQAAAAEAERREAVARANAERVARIRKRQVEIADLQHQLTLLSLARVRKSSDYVAERGSPPPPELEERWAERERSEAVALQARIDRLQAENYRSLREGSPTD